MLSPKLATCLLGLVLLLPITACFWLMIRYKPESEAELQKSMDQAMAGVKAQIDAEVTPGFPGAMATKVMILHQSTLPYVSPRAWLFTPRRWVGFTGLTCCLIIVGLWIYSSFAPSIALVGIYGRSGMEDDPTHPAALDDNPSESSDSISLFYPDKPK